MPTERLAPPPGASPPMRMTASWSGSQPTYRIQVCGVRIRPNGELPSDHTHNSNVGHPASQRKPHLPVHRPSACSAVKACPWLEQGALRNTSAARRQAAKLRYRFGPLTPSARSGSLIAGDGTKNGLSRSEQKTLSTTQNNRLTEKAPYKSSANLTRLHGIARRGRSLARFSSAFA